MLGTTYLYAGGTDGSAPVKDVYFSQAVGTGNLDKWRPAPASPRPRADAASAVIGSTVFVIGGYGPDGKPTSTVYSLTRGQDGTLPAEWTVVDAAALPEPRAGAVAVAVSDGLVLVGGTDGTAAKNTVWKTKTDTDGAPGAWTAQSPLFQAVVDATAVHVGDVVFVIGGRNDKGEPVATVQQGLVGGPEAPADDPNAIVALWRVSEQTNLPGPRTNLSSFTANGAIYVQGGSDGSVPRTETLWAQPDANGVIPGWKHLAQTDLGQGLEGSRRRRVRVTRVPHRRPHPEGVTADIARTNLAPQQPFFQLGLLGATVPALKIDGEVGQQLGYLNAATVGAINFILLILVAYALNHKEKVRALVERYRRRRS